MKCPYCGKENTRVIDSRPTDDSSIRRRRQCDECGKRFTTYEKVETLPLIVVKKDNNREPYYREKIVAGIVRSCHKHTIALINNQSILQSKAFLTVTTYNNNAIYNTHNIKYQGCRTKYNL